MEQEHHQHDFGPDHTPSEYAGARDAKADMPPELAFRYSLALEETPVDVPILHGSLLVQLKYKDEDCFFPLLHGWRFADGERPAFGVIEGREDGVEVRSGLWTDGDSTQGERLFPGGTYFAEPGQTDERFSLTEDGIWTLVAALEAGIRVRAVSIPDA